MKTITLTSQSVMSASPKRRRMKRVTAEREVGAGGPNPPAPLCRYAEIEASSRKI